MSHLLQTQSERKHVGHSNLSSDVHGTSSDHSFPHAKWQKWSAWWSKKTHNGCISSPESSDSDNGSVIDEDVSIFMKSRCRLMRIVGKLDDVFTGVQHVHTERYGPSEVEDSARDIKLRMQDRAPGLEDQQWELMLMLNSAEMMSMKVQAIRSLCTSYKARMGKQVQRRINEDNSCMIETRIVKMDSDNDLDSNKTQMEEKKVAKNPFVRGFAYILALFFSAFFFIIDKSRPTQEIIEKGSKDTPSASDDLTSRLVDEAFNRKRDYKGLERSVPTDSWMLLTVTPYPRNGIVQRCVNLETFLRRDRSTSIHVKRVSSASVVTPTIRTLKVRYLQTIEYFGEVRCCAYVAQLLRNVNRELFEAQQGLDAIHDKPFQRSKPYSDRGALLRQAVTRGEVELELGQIAHTSASRQELLTKDGLTKIVLLLEAKVEGVHMRYDSWRRAREMPGRRHMMAADKPAERKALRLETEMCFRQTSAGLVVRRICVAKKRPLVERAFGGHTVNGLNAMLSMNKTIAIDRGRGRQTEVIQGNVIKPTTIEEYYPIKPTFELFALALSH